MTDKPSERVSGRPPMPSIAPPTDEIDSEWGADEMPAPAKVPELSAQPASSPSSPPRPASVPAPRPSSAPAPRPSSAPAPRPSSSPVASTPVASTPAASNPLRKQTLLGIAPVIPPRSEPPAAAPTPLATDATTTPLVTPSRPPTDATTTPLVVPATNPLRKQTLLGIAPVIPTPKSEPPAVTPVAQAEAAPPAATPPAEAPFESAGSVPSLQTPALVATDAPTTSDVPGEPEPALPKRSEPRRSEPARAALSISHDDLPPIKQPKPRWLWPVGAAAVLALGVVGLRSLDRAPTPVPAELAHPHSPGKAASKALGAAPKSDDDDDDDDDPSQPPHTGTDDTPDPTPPEPDPLKAKRTANAAGTVAPAATIAAPSAAAASPSAAAAPSAAPAASGDVVRINVTSDPPGARMFWKGKEVGTTPFVLELQPGEKHAYELGKVGFTTRKVVIDGSKTEISIGLRPDPGSGFGSSR